MRHYIWDKETGEVRTCDLYEWAEWYEGTCTEGGNTDRTLAITRVMEDVVVSTVFLGIDHNFSPDSTPVLWETNIFGGPMDHEQWRYRSLNEALAGHDNAVAECRAAVVGWDRWDKRLRRKLNRLLKRKEITLSFKGKEDERYEPK